MPPIVHPPTIDPAAAFAALDDGVPLLLLPVRLETRFAVGLGGRELHVRIYPDQIHVNDHDRRLTPNEQRIGRAYWTAWYAADHAGDDAARTAARDWLVARLSARRAAWVARQTRPTITTTGALRFPPLTPASTGHQPVPTALPDRWAVIGYVRNDTGALQHRFTVWTAPVAADLALGLDPTGPDPWSTADGTLPVDPRLAWTVDYNTAVAKGMAVTIGAEALGDLPPEGLALVLAVGVSGRLPAQGATDLAALLEAHAYSDGLACVPQGTPTNNTDQVDAGWSFREPDPTALLARELDGVGRATTPASSGLRLAAALGLSATSVLARIENADADEETPSAAMNRALWPVTWGQYFDELLANTSGVKTVSNAAIDSIQARFIDHVRGGAAVPAIRAGAQPYGILPVRLAQSHASWTTDVQWTEEILLFLRDRWFASLAAVPRMDPVLGASGGAATNDPESQLVEVLASLPHPRRFLLRWLRDWREESYDTGWAVLLVIFGLVFLGADDPLYGHDALSVLGRWGWARYSLGTSLGVPANLLAPIDATNLSDAQAQIEALQHLRVQVGTLGIDVDLAREWIDCMITQVEQHQARQSPLDELEFAPLTFSGVLAEAVHDATITTSLYDEDDDTKTWYRALVDSPGATTREYLDALTRRVPVPVVGRATRGTVDPHGPLDDVDVDEAPVDVPTAGGLSAAFLSDQPLLYQLLDHVVEDVPMLEGARYRAALDTLAALPVDNLELRFRESLGLATHRLDAWFTSLARERLDSLRSRRPAGVQLGGFGWVVDLVPDAAGSAASQGFIHAPSLQQATTAAILRAGWSAHGTASATSTLAVDLRGPRVAAATWLLDGIRQGQSLGEMLGCGFERRLHDRKLDAWIDPIRRAVLEDAAQTRDPRGPVDGLALLELDDKGGLADVLTAAGDDADGVRASVADVRTSLDATGDAAIAESIHQVAQGNMTRAAATLDAINLGEVQPPELEHTRTPSRGPTVTHRLLVLLAGTGNWAASPRATLNPTLEAWAASVLGPADHAVATVRIGTAAPRKLSMADLRVSALDAIAEAPAGALGAGGVWADRIRVWAYGQNPAAAAAGAAVTIDFEPDVMASGEISLVELAQIARAMGAVLGRARPVDARDLAAPGAGVELGRDLVEAEARIAVLTRNFRLAAGRLVHILPVATETEPRPVGDAPLANLRAAMTALAGYSLSGALPRTGWREDDRAAVYAQAWTLSEAATRRVAALDAEAAAASDPANPPGEDQRLKRCVATAAAIVGRGTPLLLRIKSASGPATAAQFGRSDTLLEGDRAASSAWLQQVARVRPELEAFNDVLTLGDLLGNPSPPPVVTQLPEQTGERWLARHAPADRTGARLHLVAADHGGLAALAAGAPFTGLVIDEWLERIPAASHTTGLAVHFDAPASRAPQSLLLMVPPVGRQWDFDLVVDTVRATLDDAQLRSIGPETLGAYGHHLPAIYSPTGLDPGTATEEETA
ncbi:MAG TPA: hypothetical protein VGJ60_11910 [Chloroflexota bacterium]|jgi:hypothetical protein